MMKDKEFIGIPGLIILLYVLGVFGVFGTIAFVIYGFNSRDGLVLGLVAAVSCLWQSAIVLALAKILERIERSER